MAMSMREKLLIAWLLVVVVFRLVFRHFWANTVYALGKVVVLNLVSLTGLAKFAAGIFCVHPLPLFWGPGRGGAGAFFFRALAGSLIWCLERGSLLCVFEREWP